MENTARKQLADWLTANRYSQRDFAMVVGVSEFHISRILSDKTRAVPGKLMRKMLAATTGLAIEQRDAWK